MKKQLKYFVSLVTLLMIFHLKVTAFVLDSVSIDTSNILIIEVIDRDTNEPILNAEVEIVSKNNKTIEFVELGANNLYRYEIKKNKYFSIKVSAITDSEESAYLAMRKEFNLKKPIHQIKFELRKVEVLVEAYNPNLYFKRGSHYLNKESKELLDTLSKEMKEYPIMEIEFSSHTDCKEKSQIELSTKRYLAVKSYIVKKGIEEFRLTGNIQTSNKPTNACDCSIKCSKVEYQRNRRVVFSITKFE